MVLGTFFMIQGEINKRFSRFHQFISTTITVNFSNRRKRMTAQEPQGSRLAAPLWQLSHSWRPSVWTVIHRGEQSAPSAENQDGSSRWLLPQLQLKCWDVSPQDLTEPRSSRRIWNTLGPEHTGAFQDEHMVPSWEKWHIVRLTEAHKRARQPHQC